MASRGIGLGFFLDVQDAQATTLQRFLRALQGFSAGQQTVWPTAREMQIIQLLAEGKTNKRIAHALGISVRTVETHRGHVMRKLRVRSLVELLYYAMDHGIVAQRKRVEVVSTPIVSGLTPD